MQESILAQVQRVIKGEVSMAMKEQQAAVTSSIMQAMRSAAGTPIPTTHLDFQSQQAHVLQLLQQGHLNQAFQQVCKPYHQLPLDSLGRQLQLSAEKIITKICVEFYTPCIPLLT